MSLIRRMLNTYLRLVEKPRMRRAKTPKDLRRNFARSAKYFFHAPRGTTIKKDSLPGGSGVLIVTPKYISSELVIFYIHGGGFVFGSPETHCAMLGQLAKRVGARVMMPRYRLAPEFPFPAANDDVEKSYLALVASGVAPTNIVIGGDSAGGGLTFSLLSRLLARGMPLPRGAFGFSPFVDLTLQGASFSQNADKDVVLSADRAGEAVDMYVADADRADPRLNVLHTDFSGAPPVWLCVGDTEILRDDARALQKKVKDCGVPVAFHEAHDLPHVWPLFHNLLPEARQTLDTLAGWIKALPQPESES